MSTICFCVERRGQQSGWTYFMSEGILTGKGPESKVLPAPLIGPDIGMQLQLKPHTQAVFQYPFREIPGAQIRPHGREKDLLGAAPEHLLQEALCRLVVLPVAYDELELVLRPYALEVLDEETPRVSARGALHVDYLYYLLIEAPERHRAVGLDEHGITGGEGPRCGLPP